jgi:cyanate lyase
MRREQFTEKILDIKRDNGWTWKHITTQIGGVSPVLITGALLGQMKLVKPLARKAAALFGLSPAREHQAAADTDVVAVDAVTIGK